MAFQEAWKEDRIKGIQLTPKASLSTGEGRGGAPIPYKRKKREANS